MRYFASFPVLVLQLKIKDSGGNMGLQAHENARIQRAFRHGHLSLFLNLNHLQL